MRLHLTTLELRMLYEARRCAMKKRYLWKAIPRCPSAVVFAGFLWTATIASAAPVQAQTFTKPDAATPPQTEVQAAQNPPKNTPAQSGVWHHFGESDNASVAGQSQPGVWHPFGPNPGPPRVGPNVTAPAQD